MSSTRIKRKMNNAPFGDFRTALKKCFLFREFDFVSIHISVSLFYLYKGANIINTKGVKCSSVQGTSSPGDDPQRSTGQMVVAVLVVSDSLGVIK